MESPFEQAERFTSLWTEYATKMAQSGFAFDASKAPPEVAKQMRAFAFTAMANYAEQFMRSPEFLAAMKQSFDSAVTFRKQMNDFLTGLQHSAQGVARQDVDSLMLTMRHIETRLLDAISQVGARVEEISRRLDALENPAPAAAESATTG